MEWDGLGWSEARTAKQGDTEESRAEWSRVEQRRGQQSIVEQNGIGDEGI